MSTSSVNYPPVEYPDVGDPNDTASSDVSGAVDGALNAAFEDHDHRQDRGAAVPVTGLDFNGTLDGRQDGRGNVLTEQPIVGLAYLGFIAVIAASVANDSIFLDSADSRLKFKDKTGTVRTFTTVPPQP